MDPTSEDLNNFGQSFTFTATGQVLAEIDKFGDELRFSSGLELSPASEELKIENYRYSHYTADIHISLCIFTFSKRLIRTTSILELYTI
ncbi:MAG: hypothetical protein MGF17_01475 [Trichodesmium sp. MAG_R04]|nr:hypothetical protein [Trichodesmium sp. MAG_R04]